MKLLINLIRLLLLSTITLHNGCSLQEGEARVEMISNSEIAHARWVSLHYENYQFTAELQCFCLPQTRTPRTIIIRLNKVQSAPNLPSEINRSIDDWFTLLASYRQKRLSESSQAKVFASFHSHNGFPKRISIDPHPRIADDEFTVVFKDFRPLEKSDLLE